MSARGQTCTGPSTSSSLTTVRLVARAFVAALVKALASGDKPVIAYPNGGGLYDAAQKIWVGDAAGAVSEVAIAAWVRSGARGLGGCCRTTPEWVARLVALRDASA